MLMRLRVMDSVPSSPELQTCISILFYFIYPLRISRANVKVRTLTMRNFNYSDIDQNTWKPTTEGRV